MGNSNSNEESKKTFDWLDREDRDGVLTLNQILHTEKLNGVDNWEDTHSPLLLFRFDESQEGSINYQEFNKLLKHLKEANKKREARMKEIEKRKKRDEKLTSPAKSHKVWTAVDQNSAHELDLSRDSTTPAITGKPPREGLPLSSSTENLREEELEELIKQEARHFFGKLIQKSSGRKQFLTWLFHLADTDKSGNISTEELQVVLRALAHDGIMPENLTFESEDAKAQVEKIMAEYNTGKSGVLSKEEFMVLADLILKNYECITDKEDKTVGKYTLKRKLGDGSTGSVWVAVDKTSKQKRAIKIIKKGDVSDLSRIDVEIKAMLMLKHPNIVGLDEVLETDDSVFLVEELCGGGSLHEHVAEKPFKEPKARYYFKQVVDGVSYCHSVGVCHRDLKLENLLLDNNGNLKITDFGHAGIFSKGWDIFSSGLVGSLYHVSPEQISGKSYSGEKIDIWAIGILLYRLLVGKPLFFSPNPHEFVENIMNTRFTFPDHLSKEVVDLISKILKIDPEERLSLEDIMKHPWCQGPTKQLDLKRDKLHLPTGTELLAVWEPLKHVLDSFAIHCHEPALRENATIKCIYKCIYPRKDLKFSVVCRDNDDKLFLEFILKNGESLVFKKTIDKIKARLRAYVDRSINDEDLAKFSLKTSKEEES